MKAVQTTCGWIIALSVVAILSGCVCFQAGIPKGIEELASEATSEMVLPGEGAVSGVGYVTNWMVLGPFTFASDAFGEGEQQPAGALPFIKGEKRLNGTQTPPEGTTWQTKQFADFANPGIVDLGDLYGEIDYAAAYAVGWLVVPEDIEDVVLLAGSDDYVKVWINGTLVHSYMEARRSATADEDRVEGITLRKGVNRVVVKCVDVVLGWQFYLRFTDSDGKPIGVRPAG